VDRAARTDLNCPEINGG